MNRAREQELLDWAPDEAWNVLLDGGSRLACVRVLQWRLSIGLQQAHQLTMQMQDALGLERPL